MPDIQLHQRLPLLRPLQLRQLGRMLQPQLAQRCKPRINLAQLLRVERGRDTSARRMPADNDMLHLEVNNSILQRTKQRKIRAVEDIRNVAVHKHLARPAPQDGRLGDARVAASDPEDLGGLSLAQALEEGRVRLAHAGGPVAVGGEEGRDAVVGGGVCWRKGRFSG